MDLHYILVSMIVCTSHGSTLYWSKAMMSLIRTWIKVLVQCRIILFVEYLQSMNSFIKVITCSYKSFTYPIPIALFLGGNHVTHISHHHDIMRMKHRYFPQIPKLWSWKWAKISDLIPLTTTAISLWSMCVTPMHNACFPWKKVVPPPHDFIQWAMHCG